MIVPHLQCMQRGRVDEQLALQACLCERLEHPRTGMCSPHLCTLLSKVQPTTTTMQGHPWSWQHAPPLCDGKEPPRRTHLGSVGQVDQSTEAHEPLLLGLLQVGDAADVDVLQGVDGALDAKQARPLLADVVFRVAGGMYVIIICACVQCDCGVHGECTCTAVCTHR